MKEIVVTCAIILKDDKLLIARRLDGTHLENKWEFPGGKIEKGESMKNALKRELKEELGIEAVIGKYFETGAFDYEDRKIVLHSFFVKEFSGEIITNAHEEVRWVMIDELSCYDFPEADIPIIRRLVEEFSYGKTKIRLA